MRGQVNEGRQRLQDLYNYSAGVSTAAEVPEARRHIAAGPGSGFIRCLAPQGGPASRNSLGDWVQLITSCVALASSRTSQPQLLAACRAPPDQFSGSV